MEEEQLQPKQQNKYLTYLKNNKYNIYFIVAIVILISLIIAMITITVSSPKKNSTIFPSPTPQASSAPSSVSISPSTAIPTAIITTPNPTQETTIENQIAPQVSPNIGAPYTVSKTKIYNKDWALLKITNPDVGNAYIVVKNSNGIWTVMLGPGTHFDAQDLQGIGAPQEILNDANTGI